MRLQRHVSRRHLVRVCVKQKATAIGGQIAAFRGRWRMGQRAPFRVSQEGLGDFRPSLPAGVATIGAARTPFGVICGFELMIPCGFMEEILERRRCVVFRRGIRPNDTLVLRDLIRGRSLSRATPFASTLTRCNRLVGTSTTISCRARPLLPRAMTPYVPLR